MMATPARTHAQCGASLAARVGGACRAIDVQATTMVMHEGPEVRLYGVSDLASPVLLGQITLAQTPVGLDLTGQRVLAVSPTTLFIVNVADPAAPVVLSSLGLPVSLGTALGVAQVGTTAIVSAANGLIRVDVSDPASPVLLGAISLPFAADPLALGSGRGMRVPVVGSQQIILFEVGANGELTQRGGFSLSTPAQGFATRVAFGADNAAYVATLSAQGQPIVQRFVAMSGPWTYIAQGQPLVIGPAGLSPDAMVISGTNAYVSLLDGSLVSINIASPSSISLAGTVQLGERTYRGAAIGARFVAARSVDAAVIDLAAPASPVLRATLPVLGQVMRVAVSGDVAVGVGDGRTRFWNIANPQTPQLLSTLVVPGFSARNVDVAGQRAYLVGTPGLRVINFESPAAPVVEGAALQNLVADVVAVKDQLAYVGASTVPGIPSPRIVSVDVTNPLAPAPITTLSLSGFNAPLALALTPTQLISSDFTVGLQAYARGANGQLAPQGSSQLSPSLDIAVRGDTFFSNYQVYAARTGGTIARYALGQSGGFWLVTSEVTVVPGGAEQLAFDGPTLLAASGSAGLHLLNVINATAPTITCTLDTSGLASDVASNGSVIAVADGSGGLVLATFDRPVCDSVDFNNDGLEYDPLDLIAFYSVYSGGPCIPDTSSCNDIDFNNDMIEVDPTDIEALLSVYSGGPCF